MEGEFFLKNYLVRDLVNLVKATCKLVKPGSGSVRSLNAGGFFYLVKDLVKLVRAI